jgi:hypothetical protein
LLMLTFKALFTPAPMAHLLYLPLQDLGFLNVDNDRPDCKAHMYLLVIQAAVKHQQGTTSLHASLLTVIPFFFLINQGVQLAVFALLQPCWC